MSGERPVITFENDGICNCDVTISEGDVRHVLAGQSIESVFTQDHMILAQAATLLHT